VLAQEYPDFEHIVVDGGSTDGTLEILEQYPHLRWVSESDSGMYEAINKGIRLANGQVIGLLNSDDAYQPLIFSDVSRAFLPDPGLAAIVGGASVFRGSLQPSQVMRVNPWIEWEDENERWERLTNNALVTNAWFFRRTLFDQIGFFDESYRVSADRDFLLRVGLSGFKVSSLRRQVYRYRLHEASLTMNPKSSLDAQRARARIRTLREGIHIAEKYLLSDQVSANFRPYLHRWYSQRTYALAVTALFQREWRMAYNAIRNGLKFDPFWPFIFMKLGFRRFMRPLQRKR
jgi:glycosyltransferase involved in cell wall biosynthesis